MNTFFRIAWRNIWRNTRRTLIIIAAIAFSVAISTFSIALGDGSHDAILRNALNLYSGYMQIQHVGYLSDPSVELVFPYDDEVRKALDTTAGITGYAPRIQTGALVGNKNSSLGGLVTGIDPEAEKTVTIMHKKIIRGNFLDKSETGQCIIGEKMARNLNGDIGMQLVILTRGIDGSTGASRFKVRGIFRTGSDEADQSMIFITLKDGQDLLMAEGQVHSVAVSAESTEKSDLIRKKLKEKLKNPGLAVPGWRELMPALVQLNMLDEVFNFIFIGLLLLVVAFGVLSAIIAAVLERTREFGLMLALGTKPSQVVFVIMAEAFMLTFTGMILGLLLGMAISVHTVYHPINLPGDTESIMAQYGLENKLFAAIYPERIIVTALFVVVLSILMSLYPALKAASLKPDHALRCEK